MKKLLVANRGEIALRIMKTARRMGIATVAVYSEADRLAPHVRYADESVCLGAPEASQSYLDIPKLIKAAKDTGADAIHPGYGFLSERSEFPTAIAKAGITFVGPSAAAMDKMGSKLEAKKAVKDFGVPLVPGLDEPIEDVEEAKKITAEIGYPVLVKASAGGGGKGMRIVNKESELAEGIELATNEARNSFGDARVFLEKFLINPRHIEIQVFADTHGNVVHLFERECSIQRRHQKVIEEAPSAAVSPALRAAMGESAVNVAKACDYVGAGTVEFIMAATGEYYFLEMNTRLQVEHPVTEWTTGLDLVELQLRIARGEDMGFRQNDLRQNGHSIELRVYAEDSSNNFLPDIGDLNIYQEPTGEHVRVDSGYEQGMTVPIYYDPMLSKLIVKGRDRAEAIEYMRQAIKEYHIEGVKTTLDFGLFVMEHEAFKSGNFDTGFVGKYWTGEMPAILPDAEVAGIGKVLWELEVGKVR